MTLKTTSTTSPSRCHNTATATTCTICCANNSESGGGGGGCCYFCCGCNIHSSQSCRFDNDIHTITAIILHLVLQGALWFVSNNNYSNINQRSKIVVGVIYSDGNKCNNNDVDDDEFKFTLDFDSHILDCDYCQIISKINHCISNTKKTNYKYNSFFLLSRKRRYRSNYVQNQHQQRHCQQLQTRHRTQQNHEVLLIQCVVLVAVEVAWVDPKLQVNQTIVNETNSNGTSTNDAVLRYYLDLVKQLRHQNQPRHQPSFAHKKVIHKISCTKKKNDSMMELSCMVYGINDSYDSNQPRQHHYNKRNEYGSCLIAAVYDFVLPIQGLVMKGQRRQQQRRQQQEQQEQHEINRNSNINTNTRHCINRSTFPATPTAPKISYHQQQERSQQLFVAITQATTRTRSTAFYSNRSLVIQSSSSSKSLSFILLLVWCLYNTFLQSSSVLVPVFLALADPIPDWNLFFSSSTNPDDDDDNNNNIHSNTYARLVSSSGTNDEQQQQQQQQQQVIVTLPEYGQVIGRRYYQNNVGSNNNHDREKTSSSSSTSSNSAGMGTIIDFFGRIPYAAPPVGPLRFASPEPALPWSPSQLDGTEYGPDCWQIIDPIINPTADSTKMSEDCLYLNVFTPATATTTTLMNTKNKNKKKQQLQQQQQQQYDQQYKQRTKELLPVMVWLHGGAFQQGGSRRPEYDGRNLAQHGTVVVTINYRLGALGFLVSSTDGLLGNYGLMDQRAALHWVRENIQYFGGNPDNVTLFGESAGAVMTVLHLLMEHNNDNPYSSNSNSNDENGDDAANDETKDNNNDGNRGRKNNRNSNDKSRWKKNSNSNKSSDKNGTKTKMNKNKRHRKLFHKAIIQSNPLGLQFRSIVVADFIGEALKRSIDCRDLECLRAERVEEIMRAQSSLMGIPRSVGDFFTWGPTLTQDNRIIFGATSSSTATTSSSFLQRQQNLFASATRSHPTESGESYDVSGLGYSSSSTASSTRSSPFLSSSSPWKWESNRGGTDPWSSVNVSQPLKHYDRIPDDIPIIIGVNKHEGQMFVHGAFPITMTKAVYWMFVGALFRDSASRVLKHYRGYVEQIERDAEELAKKQIREEECRQMYMDNRNELDREYQFLLDKAVSAKSWGVGIESTKTPSTARSFHKNDQSVSTEDKGTSTNPTYNTVFETWSRGGASSSMENDDFRKKIHVMDDNNNNQCPWYEKLWPFLFRDREDIDDPYGNSSHKNNSSNSNRWSEQRRIREERKLLRAKERALKAAAKVVVDYRPVMSRIIGDYLFRCPAWNFAHKLSRRRYERGQSQSSVFVYQFSHPTHIPGFKECWGKACHTSELPFVFEAMDIIRTNYSTLGMYAQNEAPKSPEYPYTDILAAYRDAIEALERPADGEGIMLIDDERIGGPVCSMEEQQQRRSMQQQQHSRVFQNVVNHFFGEYFTEDADAEISRDLSKRWVSFARSGDPNYVGSKAEWKPWRKVFDNDHPYIDDQRNYIFGGNIPFNENDRHQLLRPEDFDEIFDLNGILDSVTDANINNNTHNIEGDFWFDVPEDRMYRRRALIALGMEVVEEDIYRTLLRRTKYKDETDHPFYRFFNQLMGGSTSANQNAKKDGQEIQMRRAVRQLQQIAQEMGFIGTGIRGEPRRGHSEEYWEEAFFPEVMELRWPPEGRLVERDCTCDMWDKIRYRY